MANPEEHLKKWLRDAYAMEVQAQTMLSAQTARLRDCPDVRKRIEQHLQKTLDQQALLGSCLTRLGTGPLLIKGMTAEIVAFAHAVGAMAMSDEVVRSAMAGYVFEHTQIAAYTLLIAAASAAGDKETKKICEQILAQEVEMGRWLLEHIPDTVSAYLLRSAEGSNNAKR